MIRVLNARALQTALGTSLAMVLAGCGGGSGGTTGTISPGGTTTDTGGGTQGPLGFSKVDSAPPCVVDYRETVGASDPTAPQNLCVPAAATDEKSTLLVWRKPDNYANVVDYRVYMNGRDIGSAEENTNANSPAKPYINRFYQNDTGNFHVRARMHNFLVTGLVPSTSYTFQVRAVFADGSLSAPSAAIIQKTTAVPTVLDVTAYGAVGDGTTVNTAAIQAAIDACPQGGKVLIPAGVFKSGALFLKSNMTFEVAQGATLLGSERSEDYPLNKGYVLYSYVDQNANNKKRPPSLLNAINPNSRAAGTFENIRIVGKGLIDGNGWKKTTAGQITDENGNTLPQYFAGSSSSVATQGILAGDQVTKARQADPSLSLADAYSNRRSSLMTFRGVRGLYYYGFTVRNPAYHGIMNLETENVAVNAVVHQTYDVNNGDGIEFGNSNNVMVLNNFFDTGDDDVNFAAGQGAAAASLPSQKNAWIFNNYYREGHGAVAAGSHTGAFIERILAEDNVMFHTDVDLRLKSTPQTGGGTRDIVFRDNAARDASSQAFIFTLDYTAGGAVDFETWPRGSGTMYSNIVVKNVTVSNFGFSGKPAIALDAIEAGNTDGYPETWHTNFLFSDVKFDGLQRATMDHLQNSIFNNVLVTRPTQAAPFWVCTHCINVSFTGTTTLP